MPPGPPHGHKIPKYKINKLYYSSHGLVACFRGTKSQVEGGSPFEGLHACEEMSHSEYLDLYNEDYNEREWDFYPILGNMCVAVKA